MISLDLGGRPLPSLVWVRGRLIFRFCVSVVYTFFSFGGGPGAGVEVLGAGAPDLEAGPPEKEENQDCLEQHLDAGPSDLESGSTDISYI